MPDPGRAERARIRAVYDRYRRDGAAARWDPTDPGNAAILRERDTTVRRLLGADAPGRILEVGSGRGDVLAALPVDGGLRVGVDVLADRLRDSRRHGDVRPVEADGAALPVADHSVDLVAAFTMFSSVIDDARRIAIADELTRVTRPGGRLAWYDVRIPNPANPQLRAVTSHRLRQLFPDWSHDVRSITVVPPLARRLGARTDRWYPLLGRVPLLRSHLVGVLTRN